MAIFTVCVNKQRRRKDGLYQVYVRVAHNKTKTMIKTDKAVGGKGLSASMEVIDPFVLKPLSAQIVSWLDMLNRQDISAWSAKEVVEFLKNSEEELIFSDYARRYIADMQDRGQMRNAKNYQLALNSLELFTCTNKIRFSQMTSATINRWIKSLDKTARAKEMYPICIRQVFRAALLEYNDHDAGIVRIKSNPWPKVKIPHADKPEKKAITAEECRAFFAAPLPKTNMINPKAEVGRDVAMMILCLAGINTVDLFKLRKKDYYGGIIHYRRSKTTRSRSDGAYFELKVPEVVKPLFDKYQTPDDCPALFTFSQRYLNESSFNANVNGGIKDICRSMGMADEDLYSSYTFRHTWATTAQNDCGATIEEVGFGMNHSRHSVTRGYIKPDFTPAWELNQRVIDFILFSDKTSKAKAKEEPEENTFFRISPKMLIRGLAFYGGRCMGSVEDIGFSTVDDVISRLVEFVPESVPDRAIVQFKLINQDNEKIAVYERMKGKGF